MSQVLRKERILEGFGPRLAALRQARGLTQAQLGARVEASQRMIAYYENDEAQPPGALLVDLAIVLQVSADELLGLKPLKAKASPRKARLLKRLEEVESLLPADQRAILKCVDVLLAARRRSA